MTVTVRTLMTPEPTDADRRIAWVDKPVLTDVEHRNGERFTVEDGLLYVWGDDDSADLVAVYAPGSWIFARVNAETNTPATR